MAGLATIAMIGKPTTLPAAVTGDYATPQGETNGYVPLFRIR